MFDFKPESFRIHGDLFRPLVALGIPMSLQSAAITVSMLYVNSWVNTYGVVASAVSGIGHKVEQVNNTIVNAFSTAGGSMVAQCIGAKKYDRVSRVMLTALAITSILSCIFIFCTVCWPRTVFGIFTTDIAVLDMAITYVPIAVISFVGSALRPAMFSLINGSGNSRLNLVVAILDGIIARIGLGLLLGLVFEMGVYGFWYGNALAGLVPFFIGTTYYFSGHWKKRNETIPKNE